MTGRQACILIVFIMAFNLFLPTGWLENQDVWSAGTLPKGLRQNRLFLGHFLELWESTGPECGYESILQYQGPHTVSILFFIRICFDPPLCDFWTHVRCTHRLLWAVHFQRQILFLKLTEFEVLVLHEGRRSFCYRKIQHWVILAGLSNWWSLSFLSWLLTTEVSQQSHIFSTDSRHAHAQKLSK